MLSHDHFDSRSEFYSGNTDRNDRNGADNKNKDKSKTDLAVYLLEKSNANTDISHKKGRVLTQRANLVYTPLHREPFGQWNSCRWCPSWNFAGVGTDDEIETRYGFWIWMHNLWPRRWSNWRTKLLLAVEPKRVVPPHFDVAAMAVLCRFSWSPSPNMAKYIIDKSIQIFQLKGDDAAWETCSRYVS